MGSVLRVSWMRSVGRINSESTIFRQFYSAICVEHCERLHVRANLYRLEVHAGCARYDGGAVSALAGVADPKPTLFFVVR